MEKGFWGEASLEAQDASHQALFPESGWGNMGERKPACFSAKSGMRLRRTARKFFHRLLYPILPADSAYKEANKSYIFTCGEASEFLISPFPNRLSWKGAGALFGCPRRLPRIIPSLPLQRGDLRAAVARAGHLVEADEVARPTLTVSVQHGLGILQFETHGKASAD